MSLWIELNIYFAQNPDCTSEIWTGSNMFWKEITCTPYNVKQSTQTMKKDQIELRINSNSKSTHSQAQIAKNSSFRIKFDITAEDSMDCLTFSYQFGCFEGYFLRFNISLVQNQELFFGSMDMHIAHRPPKSWNFHLVRDRKVEVLPSVSFISACKFGANSWSNRPKYSVGFANSRRGRVRFKLDLLSFF